MIKEKRLINQEKGISLIYVVFIMAILFSIAFGISRILITQVKTLRTAGQSVVAFYAADSGIEEVLMNWQGTPFNTSATLSNEASYEVSVVSSSDPNCSANNWCIKSIGEYRGIRRAIEINY